MCICKTAATGSAFKAKQQRQRQRTAVAAAAIDLSNMKLMHNEDTCHTLRPSHPSHAFTIPECTHTHTQRRRKTDSEMVDLAPLLHDKITATPAARLPLCAIRIKFQSASASCSHSSSRVAIAQQCRRATMFTSTLHIAVIGSLATRRQLWRAALQGAGAQGAAAVHQIAGTKTRIAMRRGCLKGTIQSPIIESRVLARIGFHNGGGTTTSTSSLIASRCCCLLCQQLGRWFALARQQWRCADIIISRAEATFQTIQRFACGTLLRQGTLIILNARRASTCACGACTHASNSCCTTRD